MSKYIGGTNGNDVLMGTAEDEYLYGYQGSDTLKGGGGNDSLDGGEGADTMIGGTGDDLYFVNHTGDVVREFADAGNDEVWSSVNYTLSANVEDLHLRDSAIIGIGNDLDNRVLGSAANNTLKGGGGDDYINGGEGTDTAMGGIGDDEYTVDQSSDVVIEFAGEGTDIVWSMASYTLGANVEDLALFPGNINGTGNELNNRIYGNDGSNVLTGGAGDDFLHAGHSLSPDGVVQDGDGVPDTLIGGVGNDTYRVSAAFDVVIENANEGRDEVISSFSYTLGANLENLTLENSGGAINGTGNDLDNVIAGNCYANVLTGVGGQDSFLFNTPLINVDEITDFNVDDDTIRLDVDIFSSDLVANNSVAGSQFVIGAGAFDAGDRIIYNSVTGAVYYDSDGTGAAPQIQFAQLDPGLALTNFDFLVVA
jgi:Ca2+-binding RTX toxin-like protein